MSINMIWRNRAFWRVWLRAWYRQHFTNVFTYTVPVERFEMVMKRPPKYGEEVVWEQKGFDCKVFEVYYIDAYVVKAGRRWGV